MGEKLSANVRAAGIIRFLDGGFSVDSRYGFILSHLEEAEQAVEARWTKALRTSLEEANKAWGNNSQRLFTPVSSTEIATSITTFAEMISDAAITKAKAEELERCCKAICPSCARGALIVEEGDMHYDYEASKSSKSFWPCTAAAIRRGGGG